MTDTPTARERIARGYTQTQAEHDQRAAAGLAAQYRGAQDDAELQRLEAAEARGVRLSPTQRIALGHLRAQRQAATAATEESR